jgi:hypothetical protein
MPQERRVFEFNAGDVMWLVSGVIVAALLALAAIAY